MKKLFIFLFSTLFLYGLIGCKKDSYVAAFDKSPQQRMTDTINFVKSTLVSSPNGWVAVTPVYFGGGYGFYMSFDDSLKVTMYSDLLDDFAQTSMTSQTRLRADLGVALTFDTYNYISELNNPDNNVRDGYGGDVDYIYDHTNGDSIIFLGKRYRKPLAFVKATAAQKATYLSGGYLTAIQGFKNFFTTNPNAYITLENGNKVSVEMNPNNNLSAGKRMTLSYLDQNSNIISSSSKFAFTVDQLAILDSGANISNHKFTKIAWKDSKTLAMYTIDGKEYIINNSPTPLLPLYLKLGTSLSSLILPGYKSYTVPFTSWSSDYTGRWNRFKTLAKTQGYNLDIDAMTYAFNAVNGKMSIAIAMYQNNSLYVGNLSYTYTMTSTGVFKFTYKSADGNGGILVPYLNDAKSINPIFNYDTFTMDYYVDPTYGLLAKVTSVEHPTFYFTAFMQK